MTYSLGAKMRPPPSFARSGLRLRAAAAASTSCGNDRSAEDPGERITDGGLELALDAVDQTHVTACLARSSSSHRASGDAAARVERRIVLSRHGIGPVPDARHQQNSENRITAGQRWISLGLAPSARWRGLGNGRACVIASPGCSGRVAEWQTRWLQVPVSFGTWGFKSPFAHNHDSARGSPREPRHRRR